MSLDDARELARGRIGELSDLGRRGHKQADDLCAQVVKRRERGKRLHPLAIQDGLTQRTADDDELFVRLGEFDGDLWRRYRIVRSGDHGRSLQHGTDGNDVSAFKSNFGETVLRDLYRGTSLLHLHAQLLHLGNGQAGIMSYDRDAGGLEQTIQLLDSALFCRSFHSKLSPVGGLSARGRTAGLHPSSRRHTDLKDIALFKDASGRTTLKRLP